MKTFCAACRRHITVPDHYVGRAFKCPRCGAMIGQPHPAPAAAAASLPSPAPAKPETPPSILPAVDPSLSPLRLDPPVSAPPPPVPAATKPATALYADQEIIVTPTAITLAGKTYAARNISSVETYALPPDRTNADNSILIGTILLIVGIWIAGWGIASFLAYDLLGHGPAIGQ